MSEIDGLNGSVESTRGRALGLLRRAPRTVRELAAELGLTDNAVRQHLAMAERDGLVERHGTRREWTGKPAYVYRGTAQLEALYPKAYDQVLGELLGVLQAGRPSAELEAVLRQVGAQLGASAAGGAADLRARAEHAAAVLTALGGLAEVEDVEGDIRIRGFSCPLAALTREHPGLCKLAEALVAELVGAPVDERCERGERPRCGFRISAA